MRIVEHLPRAAPADVVPFPETRQTRARRAALNAQWAIAADEALQRYAGWLWRDLDGYPDVPGWVGDAWAAHVARFREVHRTASPAMVSWPALWLAFLEEYLVHQPEWQERVRRALIGIEEVA